MVIHPYRKAAVTKFPPNIDAKDAATPGFSVTSLLLGEDPLLFSPLLSSPLSFPLLLFVAIHDYNHRIPYLRLIVSRFDGPFRVCLSRFFGVVCLETCSRVAPSSFVVLES